MSLTDIVIRSAKPQDKPYKISDSGGLYLLIKPTGGKYWRLKYRIAGKEKLLSIGAYPVITLSEARERALQAKKLLIDNIDPSQAKKEAKAQLLINSTNSFENIAREWHSRLTTEFLAKFLAHQSHRWMVLI